MHSCDGDVSCENDCLTEFKSRQIECPCEVSFKTVMSLTYCHKFFTESENFFNNDNRLIRVVG